MSMAIYAANYMNSTLPNTRTAGVEKYGQRDGQPEAGKTQESAVSASLDQANMGEDGIAVTEASRQQGAEQSATRKQPAPRMDTVEISAEGQAACAKRQEGQAGTDASVEDWYEAEDLSKYTDTELKQMYYKGDITRQEYEEETGETLE